MKKFFSIFAALLFAGSMMAVNFTLSSADAVTVEDVTVTFAKGDGNNAPAWYDNGLRLYANNTVTVSSESAITAITFNWQQQGSKAFNTVTASVGEYTHPEAAGEGKWTGSATSVTFTLGASGQLLLNTFTVTLAEGGETPVEPTMDYYVAGSMTNWGPMDAYKLAANPANEGEYMGEFTFAANDEFKVGYSDGTTIESTNYFPNGIDNNYVITEAGDYTVYFRPDGQGGEDWHEGYINAVKVETPVLADPTTCAAAAEAALSVSANNELYNDGKEYTIEGYVTSIQTAFNAQYSNISFWMADAADGGKVIQAYRAACASAEEAPAIGDKVAVTGKLTKYNSTPEFAAGCTYTIVEKSAPATNLGAKTIAEFLALKNTKDTCILTGVVSNIQNEEYGNFDLVDETGTVYIFGLLTPEGESKKFADLNVAEKDTLTVLAIYNEYNGNPQVKNAIFVDLVKGEGGSDTPGEITTCAAAAEAALSVSANNELYNNGASYTITGYVTSIAYAWKEGSMSFWMADTENGGNVLEAYKCAIANEADAVLVGDKVAVTGQLTKYNSTPEFAAGCTVEILQRAEAAKNLGEKTIAEFLALKNTKDTCILTGVVSNIKNEEYGNFDLVDETGSVYIYGLLTPEGESKKFADLNVAEKDTLTVLAIYNEYNGNPQAKNAIFVEVKKAAVEPGKTIELVFDNGGVDNYYYANYGSTDIQLYNIPVVGGELQGDGDFLQLEIYPADPNDISGEYSIEDEGLDDYYTYLMRVNGTDTTEIEFVAGSITVSVQNPDKENSSADLTVQGQLMTAEGDVYVINSTLNVYYNFTISADEKYKFDEAEADFNYNFDTYQLMPTGNDIIVGVFAQTEEAMIAATIVLPQGQTELVAGEYEVSVMPMYGTVMAGQYTTEGPQPSYALTNDGKLWYLVSGKVTVEGDGSIVIDALNSNGKAIKSTLDHLQGDGIDEVNAAIKATKTLKNGQLIIEKNGVRYNVNGQRIK